MVDVISVSTVLIGKALVSVIKYGTAMFIIRHMINGAIANLAQIPVKVTQGVATTAMSTVTAGNNLMKVVISSVGITLGTMAWTLVSYYAFRAFYYWYHGEVDVILVNDGYYSTTDNS